MGFVFCRGCSKEIHEAANNCPHCGAPQGLQSNLNSSRNTGILIVVAFGWTFIMWFMFLILGGFIVGSMNPYNPGVAGQEFGENASLPLFFISASIAALLTTLGKLPGTRKNS